MPRGTQIKSRLIQERKTVALNWPHNVKVLWAFFESEVDVCIDSSSFPFLWRKGIRPRFLGLRSLNSECITWASEATSLLFSGPLIDTGEFESSIPGIFVGRVFEWPPSRSSNRRPDGERPALAAQGFPGSRHAIRRAFERILSATVSHLALPGKVDRRLDLYWWRYWDGHRVMWMSEGVSCHILHTHGNNWEAFPGKNSGGLLDRRNTA